MSTLVHFAAALKQEVRDILQKSQLNSFARSPRIFSSDTLTTQQHIWQRAVRRLQSLKTLLYKRTGWSPTLAKINGISWFIFLWTEKNDCAWSFCWEQSMTCHHNYAQHCTCVHLEELADKGKSHAKIWTAMKSTLIHLM